MDPHDRISAINAVKHAQARGELLTGLLFMETETADLHQILQTTDKPLNTLTESVLCPGSEALNEINASLR